jgi:hypothetical protein
LNQGTIRADVLGAALTVANDEVTNTGTMQIGTGARLDVYGHLHNHGTLQLDPESTVRVMGLLDVPDGLMIPSSGTLTGGAFGKINGDVTVAGTIDPDNVFSPTSRAVMLFNGNLTLTVGAHYRADVNTSDAGDDQLQITGNLDLSAPDLFLDVRGGAASGTYVLATYTGQLTGEFEYVTRGYLVSYDVPHEILVTATPEPATLLMLSAGPFVLLRRRRARREPCLPQGAGRVLGPLTSIGARTPPAALKSWSKFTPADEPLLPLRICARRSAPYERSIRINPRQMSNAATPSAAPATPNWLRAVAMPSAMQSTTSGRKNQTPNSGSEIARLWTPTYAAHGTHSAPRIVAARPRPAWSGMGASAVLGGVGMSAL